MIYIKDIITGGLPQLASRSPEDIFQAFSNEKGAILLLSGGRKDAEYSYICLDPAATAVLYRSGAAWLKAGDQKIKINDPLDLLDDFVANNSDNYTYKRLHACAAGYISYDYRTRIEKVPCANPGAERLPDVFFTFPAIILEFCRSSGRWSLSRIKYRIGRRDVPAGRGDAKLLRQIREAAEVPYPVIRMRTLKSDSSKREHIRAVERTRRHIIEGDIYQANIARQFSVEIRGNSYPLFREIYQRNPAAFFSYINAGSHQILSSSPELLLRVDKDRMESKPIKGTMPRLKNARADERSRAQLKSSLKDTAELSMIVDLIRNDLGRISKGGTVMVKDHREIQAFTNVYHTLSTVCGTRRPDTRVSEIVRAVFPGGSITGCPKIRSMEIIDEIERSRRHIYTGSIGYVAANGDMQFNIAIRTALIRGNMLYFSVGGGIVYDSDGAQEYEETTHKARTWLDVFKQRNTP